MEKPSLLGRLRAGLFKTREGLAGSLDALLSGKNQISQDLMDELEEVLITSDLGVRTATRILESFRQGAKSRDYGSPEKVRQYLKDEILETLSAAEQPLAVDARPFVFMVVGVNGVGKTATIGKLAHYYRGESSKVLFAAADTFRAAATEQLEIWAHRVGAEMIKHPGGRDPSAVAYDAVHAARARSADFLFIDTAGRLHTQAHLMEELKKIKRIVHREMPDAPHEILLVLDATTGQNAISQARLFHEALGVTGLALTKLDGTAKGGVIVAICHDLGIPIRYVGIGEGLDDIQPFDASRFVSALLG